MSRRARAIVFLAGSLLAAAVAATLANGYGRSVAAGYGRLRPVVAVAAGLKKGRTIDPRLASGHLEVRRVPLRFAPPDALSSPAQAIGLEPIVSIAVGAYLTAGELRPPRVGIVGPDLGGGRRPVEIAVSGAGALTALAAQPVRTRVDVVVTTEPSGSGSGRAYLAAEAVPLLALAPAAGAAAGEATATLGLTRPQAIQLIEAESFARRVTVIPSR